MGPSAARVQRIPAAWPREPRGFSPGASGRGQARRGGPKRGYSRLRIVFNIQDLVYNVQYLVYDIQYMIHDIQYIAYGVWFME